MNSPNEAVSLSDAADPYSIDIDDAALPSIDFHQTIANHPMTSALIAAAAGAGLMGLLNLALRDSGSGAPAQRMQRAVSDAATRTDLADLRDQLTKWASDLLDATPSRGDVQRNVSQASDSIADTWNEVREQATGLAADLAQRVRSQVEGTADRLRPKVTAAVDLAKDNPIWLGAAIATIGAVLGASVLASTRK